MKALYHCTSMPMSGQTRCNHHAGHYCWSPTARITNKPHNSPLLTNTFIPVGKQADQRPSSALAYGRGTARCRQQGLRTLSSAGHEPIKGPSSPCWMCCWRLAPLAPSYWWKTKLQATSAAVPQLAHPAGIPFPLYFWHFKPASAAIEADLLWPSHSLILYSAIPRLRTFVSTPRLNTVLSLPGCPAQNTATDSPPMPTNQATRMLG